MLLIEQIKRATLEAGMPMDIAEKIEENFALRPQTDMELQDLLDIAKNRQPSALVWSFMHWPDTTEGFEFWSRQAHNLEAVEANKFKVEA